MDRAEYIAERAAIMEHDGGLDRVEATRRAVLEWSALVERVARNSIEESRRRAAAKESS